MKKYPKYKPSGMEWIGDLPEHWEVEKLKFWVSLVNEKEEDATNFDFKISLDIIEKFTGKLISGEATFEGLGSKFQAGDVLFNKLRPYLAKAVLVEKDGIAVSELLVLRPQNLSGKFLLYRVLANDFLSIVDGSTNGAKMPRANWDFIGNLKLAKPPFPEQTTIAAYLDRKTAQIDQAIAEKEQLTALYREERQAIINQAVTKGIRPGVKMKPSGVEWIGDVPEKWEVQSLHWLLKEPLKYGANEPAEDDDITQPRYIRITDFGDNGILREDTFKSLPIEKAQGYLLTVGDILFARSGATVGKTFQFKNYEGQACFAGYLIKASTDRKKLLSDFLYYFTKSNAYENWKNAIFNQATIQNIGADKYKNLPTPFASIEEQTAIVAYLDQKTTEIDQAIEGVEKEITLLQEYRQALIYEAVTGKIDVREETQN